MGLSYTYSNDTANTDPTAGKLKFNSTTLTAITAFRISNTDSGAVDQTTTLRATARRAFFLIQKASDSGTFVIFEVTGPRVDNSGWENFPITFRSGSGTFANGDALTVIQAGTASSLLSTVIGDKGDAGRSAGLDYQFSTDVANTDPTAGFLKFNNATLASITALRISNTDGEAHAISALLALLDASTSAARSIVVIYKDGVPATFVAFTVSGARTDNSGWKSFPITFLTSSGAFVANDVLRLQFFLTGDAGAAGTGGAGGLPSVDMIFDTTTTPPGTPTDGHFGFNNATPASATLVWSSTKDSHGVDFSSYMNAFGAADGGYILITSATPAADGAVLVLKITAGSYAFSGPSRQELTVGTPKLGDFFGPSNGDPIKVSFLPPALT
jgi:hypothetical protein